MPCKICDQQLLSEKGGAGQGISWSTVHCERCGQYRITPDVSMKRLLGLTQSERITLSGIIRHETDRFDEFQQTITKDNIDRLLNSGPRTVADRIDAFLDAISFHEGFFGGNMGRQWPLQEWIARAYVPKAEVFDELLEQLKKKGYLRCSRRDVPNEAVSLSLLIRGWEHIHSRPHRSASTKVFIARWFCNDMKELENTAIARAIEEVGLQPYSVDREDFTDPIDDQIIAELQTSRAVIVDVTGERPSVYFEAGFARGRDIPVIWCCNESWKTRVPIEIKPRSEARLKSKMVQWSERLHFDTRQFPHILWTDGEDLRRKLVNKMRAIGIHEREPGDQD